MTEECRLNITLESVFTERYKSKDYTCSFSLTGTFYDDVDCNPPTWYLEDSQEFHLRIQKKSDQYIVWTGTYTVQKISSSQQDSSLWNRGVNRNPLARISLDSKWKEYYFQNGENAIICYAFTCTLNFTGENSSDPDGDVIRYLWIYGENQISTSKDPGSRKFPIGIHQVLLRVIDAHEAYDEQIFIVEVRKPEEKIKEITKGAVKDSSPKKLSLGKDIKNGTTSSKKKKTKKIKLRFYNPPEILLQGRGKKSIEGTSIFCQVKRNTLCSMNLTLSESNN
jgi:hypothetical protein